MNLSAFDRRVLLILIFLVLVLGGVIWVGSRVGMEAPVLELDNRGGGDQNQNPTSLGASGPLRLFFRESVDQGSVESRLRLDPPQKGRYAWSERGKEGQVLSFWPERPFLPGQALTLSLDAGVTSKSGRKLSEKRTWQITIRQPEILYLSPADQPDLWRTPVGEAVPVQLTFTGGGVYDFNVTPGGGAIAYSARNAEGGLDLWEISRDGGKPRLLIPCQTDWCSSPAFSPDGLQIAYTRRQATSAVGGAPGNPRIWMLDLLTQATDTLYIDPNVNGFAPAWSPDGRYLAFFDERAQGIRVLDVEAKTDFLLPAKTGYNGSWAPDSQQLLFTDTAETDSGPYGRVYVVDVGSQQIRSALGEESSPVEYSAPAWAPDGNEAAVALRQVNGSTSKQIWIMQVDGSQRQAVTQEQQITNAAYTWSPAGDYLVFQRLEMGSSENKPFIALWSRADRRLSRVAENAFQPRWLP